MKRTIMIIFMILILGTLAGCQVKEVGGNTTQETVFDHPDETTAVEERAEKTLTTIENINGSVGAYIIEDDHSFWYSLGDLSEGIMAVEGLDGLSVIPELSSTYEGQTTSVMPIDGYMKGVYYVTKEDETHSSLVVIEDGFQGVAHLDLMSIEHESGKWVNQIYMEPSMNEVMYSVTDGSNVTYYRHELSSNETTVWTGIEGYLVPSMFELYSVVPTSLDKPSFEVKAIVFQQVEAVDDSTEYDLVINNGIVMDPDTDTVRVGYNIGVIDDKIITITRASLTGLDTVEATGLVVSPGFIDMLGFNMNTTVAKYKITDGVTTNLSLHGCTANFDSWFAAYDASPPYINYGGAVFAIKIRQEAGLDYYRAPTQEQIDYMARRVEEEILAGGVALAISPEYYPGTTPEEIRAMMAVAAKYGISTHFHTRYSSITGEDLGIKGVEEVIGYARELNAKVQIMHLHSTGGTGMMEEALAMINEARADGVDVTYDIYPYDSWASQLQMARFRDGWQERYGITYSDLQIAGTSDRLTEETFAYYKKVGGLCIAYAMDEDEMLMALSEPYVMVGSDGNIDREDAANNHFRGAGTFSRILGKYVRDENVFSLMEGLRKMTINSARQLETISNDMALRGRLGEGMIADITVFDYRTVLDQSTPEVPATASKGIADVIVSGQVGLRDYTLDTSVRAGTGIHSSVQ